MAFTASNIDNVQNESREGKSDDERWTQLNKYINGMNYEVPCDPVLFLCVFDKLSMPGLARTSCRLVAVYCTLARPIAYQAHCKYGKSDTFNRVNAVVSHVFSSEIIPNNFSNQAKV